jgi:hypothetical protein
MRKVRDRMGVVRDLVAGMTMWSFVRGVERC